MLSYSAKVQTSYTGRTRPNKTRWDMLRVSCDRRSQARVWGFHTHTEHEGRQQQKDLRPHGIRMSSCFLWPTYTVLKELRVCCRRSWLVARDWRADTQSSILVGLCPAAPLQLSKLYHNNIWSIAHEEMKEKSQNNKIFYRVQESQGASDSQNHFPAGQTQLIKKLWWSPHLDKRRW